MYILLSLFEYLVYLGEVIQKQGKVINYITLS